MNQASPMNRRVNSQSVRMGLTVLGKWMRRSGYPYSWTLLRTEMREPAERPLSLAQGVQLGCFLFPSKPPRLRWASLLRLAELTEPFQRSLGLPAPLQLPQALLALPPSGVRAVPA